MSLQEEIDLENNAIDIFEATLSELRSQQAIFENAADAVSDILNRHYSRLQELKNE